MRNFIYYLIPFFLFVSCNHLTKQEKEIRDNLNKNVTLEMIDTVYSNGEIISFEKIKDKYKYIYIVYLQEGCLPCYPKYVTWQKEMSSVNKFDYVTVLFVIKGSSYEEFINEAKNEGLLENKFYAFMDLNNEFIYKNPEIPGWIVESTFLINDKNQIKLIGNPFSTPGMTQLFYNVCTIQENS